MRSTFSVLMAAVLMGTVAVAGCSSAGRHSTTVAKIDPDAAFYADTLQQWKDYGDAIVAARVTSDRPDPRDSKNPDVNGGLFNRLATLQVTRTFWARDAAHRPPPHPFTISVWGWFDKSSGHGTRTPIAVVGNPRLEPGHSYLLVLCLLRKHWTTVSGGASVPFDGGVVGHGEWKGRDDKRTQQPAIDRLLGKRASTVQQVLDSVRLSPLSRRYSDLEPDARARRLTR